MFVADYSYNVQLQWEQWDRLVVIFGSYYKCFHICILISHFQII
jgi:hypothetical protein